MFWNAISENWFICIFIRNWIAYANEENIVNKDSPILQLLQFYQAKC